MQPDIKALAKGLSGRQMRALLLDDGPYALGHGLTLFYLRRKGLIGPEEPDTQLCRLTPLGLRLRQHLQGQDQ